MTAPSQPKSTWDRLLPDTADHLVQGQAKLVIVTCASLVAAMATLLVVWLASGDLQWETATGAVVFSASLLGIASLARGGRVRLATWLTIALLVLPISINAWVYGAGTSACAAYAIPIVLAASNFGLWTGLGLAAACSAVIWLSAWSETAGWHTPLLAPTISHLTFDAPTLSVILLMVALVAGVWTHHLARPPQHVR